MSKNNGNLTLFTASSFCKTLCCVLVLNSEHAPAGDLGGVQADDRVHFGGGGGDDH